MFLKKPQVLLRIGIAFAFLYAGVAGFIAPENWIGYFPPFVQHLAPAGLLIGLWGTAEIILALFLLFSKNVFWPALVAAALLLGVTVTNLALLDVVFRDISILFAALALAVMARDTATSYEHQPVPTPPAHTARVSGTVMKW
jgi:uncharacterized membrane protein